MTNLYPGERSLHCEEDCSEPGTIPNRDTRAIAFKERLTRLETERRTLAEDIRDLAKEMKGVGMSAEEIAGVNLSVRRSFETDAKRIKRETVEEFASSLGDFADMPLSAAAVTRHAFDE